MSQSKYKAGFGVTFLGKKSLTSMIPIYSTTVLYDKLSTNTTIDSMYLWTCVLRYILHMTKLSFVNCICCISDLQPAG